MRSDNPDLSPAANRPRPGRHAAAVVVGAAVSLATGSGWAVVVVAAHAIGTLVVATAAIQLTTQTKHASPGVVVGAL